MLNALTMRKTVLVMLYKCGPSNVAMIMRLTQSMGLIFEKAELYRLLTRCRTDGLIEIAEKKGGEKINIYALTRKGIEIAAGLCRQIEMLENLGA